MQQPTVHAPGGDLLRADGVVTGKGGLLQQRLELIEDLWQTVLRSECPAEQSERVLRLKQLSDPVALEGRDGDSTSQAIVDLITAMDLAKRLLDYGVHAPTVYFPLVVPESMMMEPTETESKETLDAFCEALFRITEESSETLHSAPTTTLISRPDEVTAARKPVVTWNPGD